MLKNRCFQQSLRTSASQVSFHEFDEDCVRQPPQKIRQNKFTKTYSKMQHIPLQTDILTLVPYNIKHLYLSHNNIKSLLGLQNYPNLISLNVSYNRLTLIQQLNSIQNPQKILRIGLKMNNFIYGYQDYAVKVFKNLVNLDDICVKNKQKVREMWTRGENVACRFLDFYVRIQRVLFFMEDLIAKNKIHNQIGLNQGKSKYFNPQLKLLFENMTQQFIGKVSQNYIMPTSQLFANMSSLEILEKTQTVICLSQYQQIDLKCTCRPRLPFEEEAKQSFRQICQKFLQKFSGRYNRELENGLTRIEKRLQSLYPKRKWQKWELFGMLQNYLDLGSGGKKFSNIVDRAKQKFKLFESEETEPKIFLKGKISVKKDKNQWRNEIFSSQLNYSDQTQKQNCSPNVLTEYLKVKCIPHKKVQNIDTNSNDQQTQLISPQVFYDRIPMVLYEKNYIEVLLEITMLKVKQILDKYDYLVKKQKQSIAKKILQIEQTQKQNQVDLICKLTKIKSFSQTQRTHQIQKTQRNRSKQNFKKNSQYDHDERMLRSTVANNSPAYEQKRESDAQTTSRLYLRRNNSQISFGRTNQDEEEDQSQSIQKLPSSKKKNRENKQKKPKAKDLKDLRKKDNSQTYERNYQLYEINLAFKVFRGLKLRVIKSKKRAKAIQGINDQINK